jgi:hypothetical protein
MMKRIVFVLIAVATVVGTVSYIARAFAQGNCQNAGGTAQLSCDFYK